MSVFGNAFGAAKPAGGSIFGQAPATQQGASPFGAFGQSNASQPQTQSTGAFGQPQQQQPAAGGTGAFGQPQQQGAQTGTSGFGTFGQQQQPQQQQSTTGASPFGTFGASTQQQQPATSGASPFGSFGASTQNQQQQQPAGTTGASPFGAFGQNQQQQQPGASNPPSLFGAASSTFGQGQQQQQPAAGATSSPFVGNFNPGAGTTQAQTTPSLFGGGTGAFGQSTNTAGAAAPSTSAFGSFGLQKPAAPAGGSVFGQSTATQQQQSSGITKSTKYTDLPQNLQQYLDRIQAQFQNSSQISSGLKAKQLGENAKRPIEQLEDMAPSMQGLFSTIVSDEEVTQDLRAKLDQVIIDTTIATQIVDGFQDSNKATNLQTHAGFPLEYFTRLADQLAHRLQTYKATVDAIERKLISLTENHQRSPQSISSTLRMQHTTFQALASRTAELDAVMKKIRERATVGWRAQTGSARNPFDQRDGGLGDSTLGRSIFGESMS